MISDDFCQCNVLTAEISIFSTWKSVFLNFGRLYGGFLWWEEILKLKFSGIQHKSEKPRLDFKTAKQFRPKSNGNFMIIIFSFVFTIFSKIFHP